jgi:hypothetical protein
LGGQRQDTRIFDWNEESPEGISFWEAGRKGFFFFFFFVCVSPSAMVK